MRETKVKRKKKYDIIKLIFMSLTFAALVGAVMVYAGLAMTFVRQKNLIAADYPVTRYSGYYGMVNGRFSVYTDEYFGIYSRFILVLSGITALFSLLRLASALSWRFAFINHIIPNLLFGVVGILYLIFSILLFGAAGVEVYKLNEADLTCSITLGIGAVMCFVTGLTSSIATILCSLMIMPAAFLSR